MGYAFVDGARVICHPTGRFGIGLDDRDITRLVIARYDDDCPDAIYLFACSTEWEVLGDLLYPTVQEAQLDASRYYEVNTIEWHNAEPVVAPDQDPRVDYL
jgi:hypothetical protein